MTTFLTQDAPPTPSTVRALRAPFPTPNEYARALWEQTLVPIQCRELHLDVYHSPNYILPLALRTPAVVTLHDLAYLTPDLHRRRSHVYLTVLSRIAVHSAQAVVTVSEHVATQIRDHYPKAAAKLHVIPEAVDPDLRPPAPSHREDFAHAYGITPPYVLYVGALEPRKNLTRLLRAFETAVKSESLPHTLVLAGPRGWKLDELDRAIAASLVRDRVVSTGYLPEALLPSCYAGADLFVYPSVEEGFGLPPLEAMTMGTPVLSSNTSAMPEVLGDAALLVDPYDEAALAQGIMSVLSDRTLADRLRAAGPPRAAGFTWAHAARLHAGLYAQVAAGGRV